MILLYLRIKILYLHYLYNSNHLCKYLFYYQAFNQSKYLQSCVFKNEFILITDNFYIQPDHLFNDFSLWYNYYCNYNDTLYYIFKHISFYKNWYILQSIQPDNGVVIIINLSCFITFQAIGIIKRFFIPHPIFYQIILNQMLTISIISPGYISF